MDLFQFSFTLTFIKDSSGVIFPVSKSLNSYVTKSITGAMDNFKVTLPASMMWSETFRLILMILIYIYII